MTKKDYIKIARAIKNWRQRRDKVLDEGSEDTFNEVEFLLDEVCYQLENDNKKFNEIKFRQLVMGL